MWHASTFAAPAELCSTRRCHNLQFGVGYIIKDELLSFCVTSKHRQTDRYLATIQRYLDDIQQMIAPSVASSDNCGSRCPTPAHLQPAVAASSE